MLTMLPAGGKELDLFGLEKRMVVILKRDQVGDNFAVISHLDASTWQIDSLYKAVQ